ncbi:hypothetical protein GCM10012288_06920 [Malaciobacter pacificus]|uniref:Uncharacterized protein n=1 Tax=Malaciobacter pacificus TaxID=1080223 RepID=A0A5C2H4R6_9BACT|nr:DnaJ domain-containing protein [Malaciobacter pacificus]QEP33980.1 hypothetical protein APAC_0841 [Malaciobacter pacificus]GGD35632.1 hypothetical protein GCM10012288_06920 [Malaciobacter pacificus]
MDYKEFEKAVDTLGILTKTSRKDLKKKYLKLSKKYHPDMPEGSEEKFLELKKSYDILVAYMDSYQYNFDIEEYKEQFPAFTNYKNWNK